VGSGLVDKEVITEVEQEVMAGLVTDTEGDEKLDEFGEFVEDEGGMGPKLVILFFFEGFFRFLWGSSDLDETFKGFKTFFEKVLRMLPKRKFFFICDWNDCLRCSI